MLSGPIAQLLDRYCLPELDAGTVERFLARAPRQPETAVLFFAGDPARWPEANDVAVILPELLSAFAGRLRGALIARAAEAALMPRFGVKVLPSLALVRDGQNLGVIPKMQDWSNYIRRIERLLEAEEADAASVPGRSA